MEVLWLPQPQLASSTSLPSNLLKDIFFLGLGTQVELGARLLACSVSS
jgi:hypothetical protein